MLSFLRFLIRMAEFSSYAEPWTGIIGTDTSQSVLDTLAGKAPEGETRQQQLQEPIHITGDTVTLDPLCADWDVLLIEIQYALQQLPGLSIQYVKGHQDRTTAVGRLPLMAQLNVEADSMASLYQDLHGDYRPIVGLTPRSRAHLHFTSGTITSAYPAAIRREYSGDSLLEHIRIRNKWTEEITQSVNWDSHGTALSKHIQGRLHYSKLVHDILPTLAFLNKQDKGKRLCPCCNHPNETRDHILRCTAPTRNRWRHAFLTSLEKFCIEHHTAPELQNLLLESFRGWLYHDSDSDFMPNPLQYPPSIRSLIAQQTAIGWRQLFNGRFGVQWSIVQETYVRRTQITQTGATQSLTGQKWQTQLILFVWERWKGLWKLRNESLHGKDNTAQAEAETKEVKRRLVEIYDLRAQMEPSAQELLCQDLQQHMLKPTWATTNWLNIHRPLFQASLRRVKTRAIQGDRNIRTYFAPI